MRPPPGLRASLLRLVELGLLVPAFGFLIPPVPSTPEPIGPFPGIAFAAAFFAASRVLSVRRHADGWASAAVKLILFVVFAWLIHQRARF